MGTYAPMTESLREMNRLLMESRQWDSQQRQAEAEWGLKEMQLKNQMANDEQMRQINEAKVAEAQEMMRPQELNVFNILNDSKTTRDALFTRNGGAFGQELASRIRPGASISADGRVLDINKEPISLNKLEFDRVAPMLYTTAIKYDDPVVEIEDQIADVNTQIAGIDKELGKFPDADLRFKPMRAELLVQRNKLKSQAANYEMETSPEAILNKLRDNYRNLDQFAVAAANYGTNDQMLNVVSNTKAQLSNRIKSIEDNLMAEKLADAKAKKGDGTGQLELAFVLDDGGKVISSKYIPVPKNAGKGYTPHDVDPTLDPKQKVVWAPQYEKTKEGKGKWKEEHDTVRRNFYDEAGVQIRGTIDGMQERIAQVQLATLMQDPQYRKMTPMDRINAAVSYPKDQVFKDIAEAKMKMKEAYDNDPNPNKKPLAIKLIEFNQWWKNTHGFSIEDYQKMFNELNDD